MPETKGILFALLTACVSGFAIFVNKFAITGLNASLFTFAKAAIVAALLLALLLAFREFPRLRALTRSSWAKLMAIGLVGGCIPFLLYFNALQLTSAINAAFIHKTLFIWVSVLALLFLKERLDRRFLAGAALLLAGNTLVFGINIAVFNLADLMILAATLLWAVENTISKRVLRELPARVVAFGRMGFGALFTLPFLFATNSLQGILTLTPANLFWIALTAGFLLLYVSLWYPALKHARASVATACLFAGLPITSLLSALFLGKALSLTSAIGMLVIAAGIAVIAGMGWLHYKLSAAKPVSLGAVQCRR